MVPGDERAADTPRAMATKSRRLAAEDLRNRLTGDAQ
jgi:hypothetical protein